MLGKLKSHADGTTVVNLMNEMHRVALDVIAKVMLISNVLSDFSTSATAW